MVNALARLVLGVDRRRVVGGGPARQGAGRSKWSGSDVYTHIVQAMSQLPGDGHTRVAWLWLECARTVAVRIH
jgi:hypothetical protein